MGLSQSFQDTFGKNQNFISAALTLRFNGTVNLRQLVKLTVKCGDKEGSRAEKQTTQRGN